MRVAALLLALPLVAVLSVASPCRAETQTLTGIEEAPIRVLVLDFKTRDKRIDASLLDTVAGLVAARLAEHRRFDVISGQEVRRLVELEGEKQAAGCETDVSCLAEIANAMGARLIVMGQLGRLGSLIVLNLSLYDSDEGRTVARAAIKSADLDTLPDALEPELDEMVRRFLGVDAPATASPSPASPSSSSSSSSSPPGAAAPANSSGDAGLPADLVRAGFGSGLSAGGALLGYTSGVLFWGLSSGSFPLEKGGNTEHVLNAAWVPALFTYLGAALGAVLYCDVVGVQVVGFVSAGAGLLTYLLAEGVMVYGRVPRNELTALGGNAAAALAAAAGAAITAPFFLAPVEE